MQRTFIKSALVGRLLAEHGFKEHPSYAEVPIERPIFVCGLPRTGTTALHRLLNADPAHQGLELWLTEVPQPRPPRETWADNPIYAALNSAFSEHHIENPEFMGIHFMDAAQRRGVLADPAPVGQVDRLRVARLRPGVLRLAGEAGLDRRLRAAQGQPAADRAQRPREAVGAEEPVPPRRARRDHGGLPRRADRADPPRPGRGDRLGVLAVRRGDQGLVDDVRRRHHRPHPARHAQQGGRAVRARAGGVPGGAVRRRRLPRVRRRPGRRPPRASTTPFGLEWTPAVDEAVTELDTESRQGGRRPSTPTTSPTTGSPRTRSARPSGDHDPRAVSRHAGDVADLRLPVVPAGMATS